MIFKRCILWPSLGRSASWQLSNQLSKIRQKINKKNRKKTTKLIKFLSVPKPLEPTPLLKSHLLTSLKWKQITSLFVFYLVRLSFLISYNWKRSSVHFYKKRRVFYCSHFAGAGIFLRWKSKWKINSLRTTVFLLPPKTTHWLQCSYFSKVHKTIETAEWEIKPKSKVLSPDYSIISRPCALFLSEM